jgi:hypothetical protein
MICPSCGSENPEGMKFCGECSDPLINRCPSCGFDNPPQFKFCGECATSLGRDSQLVVSPPKPEVPPTPQPSPSLGVSKEDPAGVALELAREWTRSSVDNVADTLGLAVTEGTPVLDKIASSLIGNQIKQKVEWTFSDPENAAKDNFRVIATGSAPIEVGLLTVKWRSTASADFELSIDTSKNQVLWWKMVPNSLKVIPSQETDNLLERAGEEVEKAKGWLQDFFKR